MVNNFREIGLMALDNEKELYLLKMGIIMGEFNNDLIIMVSEFYINILGYNLH
jgi:hypothetical protein